MSQSPSSIDTGATAGVKGGVLGDRSTTAGTGITTGDDTLGSTAGTSTVGATTLAGGTGGGAATTGGATATGAGTVLRASHMSQLDAEGAFTNVQLLHVQFSPALMLVSAKSKLLLLSTAGNTGVAMVVDGRALPQASHTANKPGFSNVHVEQDHGTVGATVAAPLPSITRALSHDEHLSNVPGFSIVQAVSATFTVNELESVANHQKQQQTLTRAHPRDSGNRRINTT